MLTGEKTDRKQKQSGNNSKQSGRTTGEESLKRGQTDMAVAGFDNIVISLLRDDGQVKKLHESLAQLDIEEEQYEAVAKVFKGSRVVCEISLSGDIETARIHKRSLALSVNDGTYYIRFHAPGDVDSFLSSLKVVRAKRVKSIFNQRTEQSSAEQYFQFYGYLSQQQNMMQDFIRTSTYQRAMLENSVDFHNKIVLDVGAGSGILSFFAIQAGARRVYAVEASSMATHCESLVEANHMQDQIVVVPGKIEEINLPEQVDIIISEPMGYMLFNERMLESYLHAKKWLKPGGKMFPGQGDLHIAPFTDDSLYLEQFSKANFWYQTSFHGVDLTSLRELAIKEYFKQPVVDTFDVRICVAKTHKHTVDFETAQEADLHVIDIPLSFTIQQCASVHGLAFWFDVAFKGSLSTVWLSTGPTQPLTHWYQVRCLLTKPIFARSGQVIEGSVRLTSNARQSYDVDIELSIAGSSEKHTNSLDLKNPCFRYTGQAVQPPPGCNKLSPTEAYWNQTDATVDPAQVLTDGSSNMIALNGDTNHYLQLQQQHAAATGQTLYNNFLPTANLMASLAGINPGSIPAAAVVSQSSNTANVTSLLSSANVSLMSAERASSVASRTQLHLTNELMIGDYVVPNNVLMPPAQGAISLMPNYKAAAANEL